MFAFFSSKLGCVGSLAVSIVGSLILYKITDMVIPLRVTDDQEHEGLDTSQHGEAAWRLNGLLSGHGHGHGAVPMEEVLVTTTD